MVLHNGPGRHSVNLDTEFLPWWCLGQCWGFFTCTQWWVVGWEDVNPGISCWWQAEVIEWIPPGFIFGKGWWFFWFFLVDEIFESKLMCFTLCQISDQIFASLNVEWVLKQVCLLLSVCQDLSDTSWLSLQENSIYTANNEQSPTLVWLGAGTLCNEIHSWRFFSTLIRCHKNFYCWPEVEFRSGPG